MQKQVVRPPYFALRTALPAVFSAALVPILLAGCQGADLDPAGQAADLSLMHASDKRVSWDNADALEPEGQADPALAALWQKLSTWGSGPIFNTLAIHRDAESGLPEAVMGVLSEPMADVSEAAAREFLSDKAALFQLTQDLNDLVLTRDVSSPLGRHFYFQQQYRGVPVFQGQVGVHFNQAGEVVAFSSTYVPDIRLSSSAPAIPTTRAQETARAYLGLDRLSGTSAELVVYSLEGVARLAWRVIVPSDDATWQVFIDARRDEVIGEARDINQYATGTGQVYRDNAVVATGNNTLRDQNDAATAVPASAYITVSLQGLVGNGNLDGPYASSSATRRRVSSSTNTFVYDRSDDGFSEAMGYYYLDYAERYIQSLGFTNVNNRRQVFSVNTSKQDNSSYSPSNKQITYGTGGVDDAEDSEVILHEYGHSIQDNQVPGFGTSSEAGAMGEGFGDYWGGSVNAQISNGFQDACVGDWDSVSYSSSNPPCLRRLDTNKHYPESVVREVHADGEIWSGALWQIRTAIGGTRADKVILQAHFLVTAKASFNQASDALITAATNLGYSATEISSIRTILQARGFTVSL